MGYIILSTHNPSLGYRVGLDIKNKAEQNMVPKPRQRKKKNSRIFPITQSYFLLFRNARVLLQPKHYYEP